MHILNKDIVIKLNKSWQAIEILTVADAVTFLCKEEKGDVPGYAMDYETAIDENGNRVLVYANPVPWEEWVNLPVRENDLYIGTSRGNIRVPLIVICARYNKVSTRNPRWSVGNVWKRDGGVCQITKRRLTKGEGNVGHNRARALGGQNTFENTILMDAQLNTLQGTKSFAEMGWTPIRAPKAPPSMPVVYRKEDAPLPEQRPFLIE